MLMESVGGLFGFGHPIPPRHEGNIQMRVIMILALLIAGCGKTSDCGDSNSPLSSSSSCSSTANATSTDTSTSQFILRGSVVGAFEVDVDGTTYDDIESFYTAEAARLPAKVEAAGYSGYSTRFDAEIGFRDLTAGMIVFVAPKTNRGYATKTVMAKNDTFALSLPAEAAGDTYQVKATKRISVILTKGSETKKFCYNFSAQDLEVPYDQTDKPVVISSFKSSLTTYDCPTDPGTQGISIPANSDIPVSIPYEPETTAAATVIANLRNAVKPDLSREAFFQFAGLASGAFRGIASHDSNGPWQVELFSYSSGMCEADVNLDGEFDCFAIFDMGRQGSPALSGYTGALVYQSGFRAEYLATDAAFPSKAELNALIGVVTLR